MFEWAISEGDTVFQERKITKVCDPSGKFLDSEANSQGLTETAFQTHISELA